MTKIFILLFSILLNTGEVKTETPMFQTQEECLSGGQVASDYIKSDSDIINGYWQCVELPIPDEDVKKVQKKGSI